MHRDEEKAAAAAGARHAGTSWLDSGLRVIALVAMVAALVCLTKSNQEKAFVVAISGGRPIYANLWAKWQYGDAFRYLLATNIIIGVYSLLLAVLPVFMERASLVFFLFDFVMASLLLSAASSATTMAYLGERGNPHTQWKSICSTAQFRFFCVRILGAIIASFVGWIALSFSTISAARRLRN